MRCKACDAPVEGLNELCGPCNRVSTSVAQWAIEVAPEETMNDNLYFGCMVKRCNLGDSWREGLGLIGPETRFRHLHDRALERFRALRRQGMSQDGAFFSATGVHK